MPVNFIEEWIWESIPCSKKFEININRDLYAIIYKPQDGYKNWALYKNNDLMTIERLPIEAALQANRKAKHKMQLVVLSNRADDNNYKWQWHILEKISTSLFARAIIPLTQYKNKPEDTEYILYANNVLNQIEIHRNIGDHKNHIFTTDSMNEAFILSEKIGNLTIPLDIHKFASYSRNIDLFFDVIKICKYANMITMNYSNYHSYKLEIHGNTLIGHITINGYMEYERKLNNNVHEVHRNVSPDKMYNAFSNDYIISN